MYYDMPVQFLFLDLFEELTKFVFFIIFIFLIK